MLHPVLIRCPQTKVLHESFLTADIYCLWAVYWNCSLFVNCLFYLHNKKPVTYALPHEAKAGWLEP